MTKEHLINLLKQDFHSDIDWEQVIRLVKMLEPKSVSIKSSWDMNENVDRMGGSFSQSEIDEITAWR